MIDFALRPLPHTVHSCSLGPSGCIRRRSHLPPGTSGRYVRGVVLPELEEDTGAVPAPGREYLLDFGDRGSRDLIGGRLMELVALKEEDFW